MKRAAVFSFSARGAAMAARVAEALGEAWSVEQRSPRGDLMREAAECFQCADALIFVGACGIAVRAVGPLLVSKASDPAVVALDECGRHVIPLVSGHIGGANELAQRIAARIGGEAVVTTATDVNGRFSVDAWAARQGLWISDLASAKRFSAEILKRDLPLCSDFPVEGALPSGVYAGDSGDCGAALSCRELRPFAQTLLLVPRILHLGIGCRRGATAGTVRAAIQTVLAEHALRPEALRRAASIDLKSDEAGLLACCAELNLPLNFYAADELRAVPGEFTASAFVCRTVGVDNVCERSAMRSAGRDARLLVRKRCIGGVTVAVAQEDWRVSFE